MFNAQRYMVSAFRVLSLAALLLVATTGCDGTGIQENDPAFPVTVEHEVLTDGAVDVDEIARGAFGDIQGTTSVIQDEETYASFWEKLHAGREPVPQRPHVDFETEVVVAIVLDEKPTGGYGVRIDEVTATENGEQMEVRFTEVEPGDECGVIQVLTSPYVVATAETQAREVTFSRSVETRSCDE